MSKRSPKELIAAVGYLRKSTKGTEADGRERQEKSLPQQKTEIVRLAKGTYQIVDWYADPGVSGWKRGAKRPDFQRMLDRAKEKHDFQAILTDNIDRFSRASVDEVQEDALALKRAGVRWIVTAAQGTFDLGRSGHDIGEIMKFVVAVWSAHEYSRQLSRRITLARRNGAAEGRRTGGNAAFGLANNGKGGLKHGDPKEVKVVRWIFDQFANQARSLRWICGDLNRRNIVGPRGGKWAVKSLAQLLRRRAYRGDFIFNARHGGQFFGIDGKGEVVEAAEANGAPGKLFLHQGAYKPLVDPALFDKAQRRIEALHRDRSRRKAQYALSGILVCDHCGSVMYGAQPRAGHPKVVYVCSSNASHGLGTCKGYSVREDAILPFLMRLLGEEIQDIKDKLSAPPEHLRSPRKAQRERREQLQRERETLAKQIAVAESNILLVEDARTRKALDLKLTELRDHLEALELEMGSHEPRQEPYSKEELEALTAWWKSFQEKAVSVPVTPKSAEEKVLVSFHRDPLDDSEYYPVNVLFDPRLVNETLRDLGAEVRLRWKTAEYTTSGGVRRNRHTVVRGRFRLGQQRGRLAKEKGNPTLGIITSGPPESPWRALPEISNVS